MVEGLQPLPAALPERVPLPHLSDGFTCSVDYHSSASLLVQPELYPDGIFSYNYTVGKG
jgi:hypothetical protein